MAGARDGRRPPPVPSDLRHGRLAAVRRASRASFPAVRGPRRSQAVRVRVRHNDVQHDVPVQGPRHGRPRGRAAVRDGRGRVHIHGARARRPGRGPAAPAVSGRGLRLAPAVPGRQLLHRAVLDRAAVAHGLRRRRPVDGHPAADLRHRGVRVRRQHALLDAVRLLPGDRVFRAARPVPRHGGRVRDARPPTLAAVTEDAFTTFRFVVLSRDYRFTRLETGLLWDCRLVGW